MGNKSQKKKQSKEPEADPFAIRETETPPSESANTPTGQEKIKVDSAIGTSNEEGVDAYNIPGGGSDENESGFTISAVSGETGEQNTNIERNRSFSPPTGQMSERGAQTTLHSSTFVEPSAAPELGEDAILIIDAQKTSDGVGASHYIAYLIQCGTLSAKRRYSEFASLREALVALHPTLIIPPIPSKHTLTDYAARQSKAKEDATIIARRKRMLQVFLNRVKDHEKLSRSVIFRRFLDGRWSWHEITSSPPLSMLPKSNLRAPALDPASPHASPAYLALPLPPSNGSTQLKNPNQRFVDSEAFTERFRNHIQGSLEKTNRRVMKRWTEASNDYAELGAILNEFSLSEGGALASAIERTGQASDQTFMAIGTMLHDWETQFTEPLNEYSQYASVLQKLLKWRHQKHLQLEMAQDALEAKRLQLEDLERVEAEASRLNRALESGGRGLVANNGGNAATFNKVNAPGQSREGVWDSVNSRASTMRKSVYGSAAENEGDSANKPSAIDASSERLADSEEWTDPSMIGSNSPSRPTSPPTATNGGNAFGGPQSRQQPNNRNGTVRQARRTPGTSSLGGGNGSSGGVGLLGALSQTFQSVMDVDPEATRRNTISRLKDNCAQLDEALELTDKDLRNATLAIQSDLDRFQRQKIRDFRAMTLAFAQLHRDYCKAGLDTWKEAKQEIEAISDHTPVPESNLARHQATISGGSSSTPVSR